MINELYERGKWKRTRKQKKNWKQKINQKTNNKKKEQKEKRENRKRKKKKENIPFIKLQIIFYGSGNCN